jgi:hypothetical protein
MARSTEGKLAPIILNAGMNQSAGIHGGIAGSLEYAINCRIKSAGRLQRRCGTNGINETSTGPADSVGALGRAYGDSSAKPRPTERPMFATTYQGEPHVASTAGDVFMYDDVHFEWRGACSAVQPMGRTCAIAAADVESPINPTMPAVAVTSNGFKLIAATGAESTVFPGYATLNFVVISPDGAVVYRSAGDSLITNLGYPRIRAVTQGTKLLLLFQLDANVEAFSWETSTGALGNLGAAVVVRALNSATAHWDATGYDSNNWYIVARTGATTCTVQAVNNQTPGSTATFSTTGEVELSIWGDATNGNLWVGYLDDPSGTPNAGFVTFSSALASVYTKTTLLSSAAGVPLFGPRYARAGSSTVADVFYVFTASTTAPFGTRFGHVVAGTPSPATPHVTRWITPVTKPDVQQRWWAVAQTDEDAPLQFVLVRHSLTPTNPYLALIIEASSPLSAAVFENYTPGFHAVAVQSESAGGRAFIALPQMLATATAASGHVDSVAIHLYEYARHNQEPTIAVDVSTDCIVSGQPTALAGLGAVNSNAVWPGSGTVELGYPQQPVITAVVATPNAAGLAAGSYQYQAVFQWADQFGRRHLSAPSPVWDLDISVASSIALTVSDCQFGQRHASENQRIAVLLYRTVDGGEVPQLLPFSEPSLTLPQTGTVSFTDTIADSVVGQNEFIYTGGGVLPNRLAPSCRYVKTAEDRVWVGGLWDENIIEASKVLIPSEPPNFTLDPSHQVVLPGPCTGLAYQDGQIVAFTEHEICLVGGEGPNDQGAGSFLAPQPLIRGLGCAREESASILETEAGIIFRSKSSWWLIPRGFGQPQDIGAAVQDESQHCIAAALTETSEYRLARFLIAGAGVYSSDTVLTLDLTNMQWFRDVYTGAAFGTIGPWPDGLALCQYSLDRSGSAVANVIWYESEDAESDAAASPVYIPYSFRTNWQYPFGPSGWGQVNRVQLAMEPLASATQSLAITIETDANSYAPTAWIVAGTVAGGPVYRQVSTTEGKRHCTAFRVTVAITQSSGSSTAGYRFLSLTTELGPDGPGLGMRELIDDHRA